MASQTLQDRTPTEATATDVVRLTGIRKQYGEDASRVDALRSIDLTVRRGEMVALMGPSGSGKSTLLNVLGLLDQPSGGTYVLSGEDVTRLTRTETARLRGDRVAFVFQGIHLLPRLTAQRNVELPMGYARLPGDARRTRARAALEKVGILELADRLPNQISGGQAQRVAIARAIATDPDLLLADEPTGALDRRSGLVVLSLFQALHRDEHLTLVLVTHDPLVARCAERVVSMEDGEIISDEAVTDRLDAQTLLEEFDAQHASRTASDASPAPVPEEVLR